MQKFSKYLLAFAIISFLVMPFFVMAQNNIFGMDEVENGLNNALNSGDPRVIIGRIINVVLGFLGVIAVGIILLGGFKWMTAGGNEDKVAEAKKLLGAGVIGLVIILAAWAIATYVIGAIYGNIF
ncbi:MAG: pilin [Patescibacteria group bacterium]